MSAEFAAMEQANGDPPLFYTNTHLYFNFTSVSGLHGHSTVATPFTQLLQTRVCFTNAGINTYGAAIHKVRKHAIHAFPSFLFLKLLVRLYVKEPFSEIMERQNGRLV